MSSSGFIIAPLRPPDIVEMGVEVGRDHLGELVLEPLAGLVRERQVVGIGAGGEVALRDGVARAERQRGGNEGEQLPHLRAAIAPHGRPPRVTVFMTLLWTMSMIVSVPDSPLAA